MTSLALVRNGVFTVLGILSAACSGEAPVQQEDLLPYGGAFNANPYGGMSNGGMNGFPPGTGNAPPFGNGGTTTYPPPGSGGAYTFPPGSGGAPPFGAGGVPPFGTGGVPFGAGGNQFGSGGTQIGAGGNQFGSGGTQIGAGGTQGGTGGAQVGTGGSTSTGNQPPADKLPTAPASCPNLANGAATINGTSLQLWVGSKPGPMYFYWHATGQHYQEVNSGMPGATSGVGTNGGIVASFETTNAKGTNTGNNVWYTGDFETADQILACGIQKGLVDTSRIYTAGYSAGGLQACAMVAQRGKYLAGAICYSGGAATISGTPQDKSHLPPTLLLHGAPGKDTFIIDFAQVSGTWANAYKAAGGFAINCDDGGDHIASAGTRMGFGGRAMPFFADHPYGVSPEPYNPLPGNWPSYCQIVK